jgi:tetratricopeptide (TPR) repeat protein
VAAALFVGLSVCWTASAAENARTSASVTGTLNNGVPASLVRGWPWTLRVTAFVVGGSNAALLPAGEPQVTVTANGQPVAWPWQRSNVAPKPTPAEDVIAEKDGWFFLSAEQTAAIAAGDYQVAVNWSGQSAPNEIVQVLATADPAGGATELTKARLTSQVAALRGDLAGALAVLDRAIAAAPDSVGLLSDKAAILEEAGRTDEALATANKALALFRGRASRQTPPPILLLKMRDRLFAATLAQISNEPLPSNPTAAQANAAIQPDAASPVSTESNPTPTARVETPPLPPATAASPGSTTSAVGAPSLGEVVTLSLSEAQILATPNAQWASGAVASSRYGVGGYSELQATGQPNVSMAGNDSQSWCPATKGSGTQWLELSFAQAVRATEVRIRQNNAPGAVVKIEAIDADGVSHLWWSGRDPYVRPRVAEIAWFVVRVPVTDYRVQKVRVTFDLSAVADWVEVDAVQLVPIRP